MLHAIRSAIAAVSEAVTRTFAPRPMFALVGGATQDQTAVAEYDAEHAMSAIGAYAWARVGIEAPSANLSQVPIIMERAGEVLQAHWMLDLLARPEPDWGAVRWRRQIVADIRATGNAIAIITRGPDGRPRRLRRQHPAGWQPAMDEVGDIASWRSPDGTEYPTDRIWHVSDISWRPGALAKLGESPVRPLDSGIRAALAARKQAAKAAERGRLELLVSSKVPMSRAQAQELSTAMEEVRQAGTGALIASQDMTVQPLSLAARDLEFEALDDRARVETGAVFGVPPVRRQDPSANYGAAKQEMRQYWENLQSLAALIDEELTYLVDEPGVTVRHSFEAVEALQTSYTERLNRVVVWYQLGADPYAAARYERFTAPPLTAGQPGRVDVPRVPADPSLQVDTPQAQSLTDRIARELTEAASWIDALPDDVEPTEPMSVELLHGLLRGGALDAVADAVALTLAEAGQVARDTGMESCAALPAFGRVHAELLTHELEAIHG